MPALQPNLTLPKIIHYNNHNNIKLNFYQLINLVKFTLQCKLKIHNNLRNKNRTNF